MKNLLSWIFTIFGRNALWYDEEPDFKTPTSNEHWLEGDRLLREGKYKEQCSRICRGHTREIRNLYAVWECAMNLSLV